jgi:hypothetical protein
VEAEDLAIDAAGPGNVHPPLETEPSVLYLSSAGAG